jgi:DnaJ-class molecular chaperone
MTREKFIKKWLGNKDYQYTEQNRDLMRDDLDEVINQALRQPPVISSVCHFCNGSGKLGTLDEYRDCDKCNGTGQTDV